MIERLKQLFLAPGDAVPAKPDRHQLAVAATALMVQLARIDRDQDERELEIIVDCAVQRLDVTQEEADAILQDALNEADGATSLYEFTGLINDHLDQERKQQLLESIWQVAFADGRIDRYEEHLIRRMAELLHLNHREYMMARHRAEQAGQPSG